MNSNYTYQSLKPEDVIETDIPIVDSQMGVIEAIKNMNQKDSNKSTYRRYSYVLVVEKSKLVGIITERDIVKLTSAEINLVETKVDAVMTKKLITLKKSEFWDIQVILKILREKKIRHLPIVDDRGQLEGIVALLD